MVWLVGVGASLRVTGHKVQAAGLGLEAMCVLIIIFIYLSMVFSWSCGSQIKAVMSWSICLSHDREWMNKHVCTFSRTGVLSATFLHSLAGVQRMVPQPWFSQCQTHSHMLPGCFCMQQPLYIYPSNNKLFAMTASAYESVGCISTLDFPRAKIRSDSLAQVDR